MTDTRDKLNEAEYFLGRMEVELEDRNAFRYNVGAFASAARSVTLFMQKEYAHAPGFDAWYCGKRQQMADDKDMRFFDELRVATIHTRAVSTRGLHYLRGKLDGTATLRGSLTVISADGTVDSSDEEPKERSGRGSPEAAPDQAESTPPVKWYFRDRPDEESDRDVLTLCHEHFGKLEAIVAECESQSGCEP